MGGGGAVAPQTNKKKFCEALVNTIVGVRKTCFVFQKMNVTLRKVPYILESNPRRSYIFRGLKNQMRIRITCGLDSQSRAGFWKNESRCTCRKNNTIIYYYIYYL